MDYKRLLSRKRASIPATIEYAGGTLSASIRDVSMKGAFLISEQPFTVGSKICIRSEYMMMESPFQIEAEVVSRRTDGVGVKFECQTDRQKQWVSFLFR